MDRTQTACYFLIASAFVLAGLLITQLNRVTPAAQAEMINDAGTLSLMTAQTASDEESLFILDGTTNRLMVVTLELGRGGGVGAGRLSAVAREDLTRLFGTGGAQGGGGGGRSLGR